MLQTLLWRRMTYSLIFLKCPLAVLVQTPATYILMYCNASSTAFPAVRCFQFRKKVLRLKATLYRSSDRTGQHLCLWPEKHQHQRQLCEEFALQPEKNASVSPSGPAFYRPKWPISLPFHILQQVKSLPFHIPDPEAWERHPFRAEPLRIDHYREYLPSGSNPNRYSLVMGRECS